MEKLGSIERLSKPNTKTELRAFLGLCQFYAKFIHKYSDISGPLSDLLRKNVKEHFVWNEKQINSFENLKISLCRNPILKLPDTKLPYVVRSDGSSVGLGAVLIQYHGGIPHPIAYASRKLLDRETRYSTIERELLALVFAISKFKYYLLGGTFLVEVDHQPLVYLRKFKDNNSRLMRWALGLQSYDFRVVHIATW